MSAAVRSTGPGARRSTSSPRCASDRAYANLVLPQVLRKHGLEGRDAALATELASGAIRMQGLYDPVIDACLTKPKLQAEVRDVLRLGVHQLLSMRVPDHAAISTSVDLVKATVGRGPSGLVNAVLRKVSTRSYDDWVAEVAPDRTSDPRGHLAVARSHPRWVVDALGEALGPQTGSDDELDALLAADNAPPRVTLAARPGLAEIAELEAAGGSRTSRSPYGVVLAGGDPAGIPAVAEGRAGVQDEGSQLVALAMADAELEGRDELWLDLCAGPGGKAALLGALAAQRGARLVANERQPHRATLVSSAVRAVPDGTVHVAGRGRHATAVGAGHVRPGARRRALLGARCPASAAGVALAAYARGRRRARRAPAGAARRGHRLGAPGGRRRLRDVLAGARRDDGGGRGGARPTARHRRGRALPAVAAPRRHGRDVRRHAATAPDLSQSSCRCRR